MGTHMGGRQNQKINDGIKNKNFVVSSTQRENRPGSTHGASSLNQSLLNLTTPLLSPAQSTLGKLLHNNNNQGKANTISMAQQTQQTSKRNQYKVNGRQQAPRGGGVVQDQQRIAQGLTMTTQTQQHSTMIADDTCNVLPSQPVIRGQNTTVRERLFKLSEQANAPSQQSFHVDYRLVHERRMAKEVVTEVNMGRVELTYSNNSLACLSDILIKCKELPSFRDIDLLPVCLQPARSAYHQLMTLQEASEERQNQKDFASFRDALTQFPDDSRSTAQQKARKVNQIVQTCHIDAKLHGERLYISFFDHKNRDQVAKFVSPPVSFALSVHPNRATNEASYEIFGFQMQQSTDLNLIGNFTGTFLGQAQMFIQHESIRKGKVFYDGLLEEQRRKEDEKRHITQQILRKQTKNSRMALSSGLIDDYDSVNDRKGAPTKKKAGDVFAKKLFASKSGKPNVPSNQAIKPGASIKKLGLQDDNIISNRMKSFNKESMVSNGLLIQECPSKQINCGSQDSDVEDLPYPQEDDDDVEDSDDAALRDKHETELSERMHHVLGVGGDQQHTLEDERTTKMERFASQNSGNNDFGPFLGNDGYPLESQDLKSPTKREDNTMRGIIDQVDDRPTILSNNSNLREATAQHLNQAFVQIGAVNKNSTHVVSIDNKHMLVPPIQSNTHTDSADGGEALSYQDDEYQYNQFRKDTPKNVLAGSQQVKACDQDEPLLPGPPPTGLALYGKFNDLQSPMSNCSDLQVFEDPSIQHNPKNTKKKPAPTGHDMMAAGSIPLSSSTKLHQLHQPGLPSRCKSPEETKTWKSTRETQNYTYANQKGNIFKLASAKERSSDGADKGKANLKFTPNHLLNFSKQLSGSYGGAKGASSSNIHEDLTPSIGSQPKLMKRVSAESGLRQRPLQLSETAIISPSKRRGSTNKQQVPNNARNGSNNGYRSQKQLQEVMKQQRSQLGMAAAAAAANENQKMRRNDQQL